MESEGTRAERCHNQLGMMKNYLDLWVKGRGTRVYEERGRGREQMNIKVLHIYVSVAN